MACIQQNMSTETHVVLASLLTSLTWRLFAKICVQKPMLCFAGSPETFDRAFMWHRSCILNGYMAISAPTQRPMVQLILKTWLNFVELLQEEALIARVVSSLTSTERQLITVGVCSIALSKAGCPEVTTPELRTLHFYGHVSIYSKLYLCQLLWTSRDLYIKLSSLRGTTAVRMQ